MKKTLLGLEILDKVAKIIGSYYIYRAYGIKGLFGFFLLIVITTTNEVMNKKFGEES